MTNIPQDQLPAFIYGFLLDAGARRATRRDVDVHCSPNDNTRLVFTHDGEPQALLPDKTLGSPHYQHFLNFAQDPENTPHPAGRQTIVILHSDDPPHSIFATLHQALRHVTQPVRLRAHHEGTTSNSATTSQPFLKDAHHTHKFETPYGPVIAGTFFSHQAPADLSIGGILYNLGLPVVSPPPGHTAADAPARLKLDATPAPQLLEAAWYGELSEAHHQALKNLEPDLATFLYTCIIGSQAFTLQPHDIPRAKSLGTPTHDNPRLAIPWAPPTPEDQPNKSAGTAAVPETDAAVIGCSTEEALLLHHAAAFGDSSLRLFTHEPALAGHPWHDQLPRVIACKPLINTSGEIHSPADLAADLPPGNHHVPVSQAWIDTTFQYPDGSQEVRRFATDVLTDGDIDNNLSITVFTTPDHQLTPDSLAAHLEVLYFTAYHEEDLDHPDLQLKYFREETTEFATHILISPEEGLRRRLKLALEARLLPLVSLSNHLVTITLDRGNLHIDVNKLPTQSAPD